MIAFDTLKASRRLRDAGIEEAHAEALVGAFTEDIGANLATKDDIALLRNDIANAIASLENTLRSEMALREQRMNLRIALAIGSATTVLLAAIAIATGILASRL